MNSKPSSTKPVSLQKESNYFHPIHSMNIFIICSKSFYGRIPEIKTELESMGHVITLPNSYENPLAENSYRDQGKEAHATWKAEMIRHSEDVISKNDAVLVLNFEKNIVTKKCHIL